MKKHSLLLALSAAMLLASCGGSQPTPQPTSETSSDASASSRVDSDLSTGGVSEDGSSAVTPKTSEEALDAFLANTVSGDVYRLVMRNKLGAPIYSVASFGEDGYAEYFLEDVDEQTGEPIWGNYGVVALEDIGGFFEYKIDEEGEIELVRPVSNTLELESPVAAIGEAPIPQSLFAGLEEGDSLALYLEEDAEAAYTWHLDVENPDNVAVLMPGVLDFLASFGIPASYATQFFASGLLTLEGVDVITTSEGDGAEIDISILASEDAQKRYGLPSAIGGSMLLDHFDGVYSQDPQTLDALLLGTHLAGLAYAESGERPAAAENWAELDPLFAEMIGENLPLPQGATLGLDVNDAYFEDAGVYLIYDVFLGADAVASYADLLTTEYGYQKEEKEEDEEKVTYVLDLDAYGEKQIVLTLGAVQDDSIAFPNAYLGMTVEFVANEIVGLDNVNAKLAAVAAAINLNIPALPASEKLEDIMVADFTDEANLFSGGIYDAVLQFDSVIAELEDAVTYVGSYIDLLGQLSEEAHTDSDGNYIVPLSDGRELVFSYECVMEQGETEGEEIYSGETTMTLVVREVVEYDIAWINAKLEEIAANTGVALPMLDPELPAELNQDPVYVAEYPMQGRTYAILEFHLSFAQEDDIVAFVSSYCGGLVEAGFAEIDPDTQPGLYADASFNIVNVNAVERVVDPDTGDVVSYDIGIMAMVAYAE